MGKVIEVDVKSLTGNHLCSLCTGDALAIRIPNFVQISATERAKEKLFFHQDKGALGHAREFTRLGIAYAEIKTDEIRQEYHQQAIKNIQRIRDIFGELASPIEHFRTLLDDIWPEGAHLLSVKKQKCFVGVCRYLTPNVDLEPHIDSLEWTLPPDTDWTLQYQLSANIYMQVPDHGGELEMWDIQPSALEYERLKGTRHYGINRHDMPTPDLVIKPKLRDLIILNPRFIHAVRPVKEQDRITLSSFIGVISENDPLVYWS
ncbi:MULTISPECIES: 2OG-Fe(II) oxygenase [Xenorhabdus]|uniref:2OG-Fe(II) oxygenase n=1 Tax=Xenorhabdus TaxID=626 RepID=UPI00064A8755|nr:MULTISPECIES: 2OG-Fe(II) oxygenase [Xenorhabdus]KLU14500.1 proline hydroxylase [Xenorhabdus griffiniae]KOP34735.1 proline hydroxylase [Xenorhabdus sp. GDc328]